MNELLRLEAAKLHMTECRFKRSTYCRIAALREPVAFGGVVRGIFLCNESRHSPLLTPDPRSNLVLL